jgi:hypothetical protein
MQVIHNGKVTSMATQRREESERRLKRQGSGIRKEGGDEFKASPTRGRISEKVLLCANDWNERKANIRQDSQGSKQQDQQKPTGVEVLGELYETQRRS